MSKPDVTLKLLTKQDAAGELKSMGQSAASPAAMKLENAPAVLKLSLKGDDVTQSRFYEFMNSRNVDPVDVESRIIHQQEKKERPSVVLFAASGSLLKKLAGFELTGGVDVDTMRHDVARAASTARAI